MKTEGKRFTISFAASLLLHGLIVAVVLFLLPRGPGLLLPDTKTVVVRLEPHEAGEGERPREPQTLADAIVPTNEPVGPTDLIAEQNSKAQDMSEVVGNRLAPFFEKPAEFDHVAGPPPQEPIPETKNPEEPTPVPTKSAEAKPPAVAVAGADKMRVVSASAQVTSPDETDSLDNAVQQSAVTPQGTHQPESGGWEAERPTGEPKLPPGEMRGRVDGGVVDQGFLGFEALKSGVAPYLKEVRARVVKNWYAALSMRYSGTMPTKAIVDCAIRPDGTLAYAKIIEPGPSPSYAPLCKEAIERAGPFPRFPFQVPDIYRNKDLEIRWTFSFLQ